MRNEREKNGKYIEILEEMKKRVDELEMEKRQSHYEIEDI